MTNIDGKKIQTQVTTLIKTLTNSPLSGGSRKQTITDGQAAVSSFNKQIQTSFKDYLQLKTTDKENFCKQLQTAMASFNQTQTSSPSILEAPKTTTPVQLKMPANKDPNLATTELFLAAGATLEPTDITKLLEGFKENTIEDKLNSIKDKTTDTRLIRSKGNGED